MDEFLKMIILKIIAQFFIKTAIDILKYIYAQIDSLEVTQTTGLSASSKTYGLMIHNFCSSK